MNNDKLKRFWCYWNGYGVIEVRSIGHKWVWLRTGSLGRFSKIKRGAWDKLTRCKTFMTLDELKHQSSIRREVVRLGISITKPCRKLMSHPTRKFGWEYKTLEELKTEVAA
tara:strand:- start:775 stop:1107 length:333 start_codon:yes stop_codon:yes gene_type:complete